MSVVPAVCAMSSETVSLLLRPQCSPAAHHAAVTSMLFLDDVELLRDRSQQPSSRVLPHTAEQSRAKSHAVDESAELLNSATTASSWLAALSQSGPSVHRPARSLVTAARDATVRLWHVREEEEEGAGVACCGLLEGHTEWISDLCLLGDKRTLVSSSADSLVKLWDLQTGLCTQTLAKHTDYVECLAYSQSSRLLASAGLSNQLYLWKLDANYPTPAECLSLPGHSGELCHSLYALDITPSGNLLATGGTDKVVRCWDTRSGSVWLQLLGHERLVRGVRLKDDGWQAVSVSADNTVKLWELRMQRCVATCHIKEAILARSAHSSNSGESELLDPSAISAPPSTYTLAVSDTFHKAYTGHSTGIVVCTDLSSGHSEPIVALPSAAITVRLDQSRHQLWCASYDSAVTCWDVRPTMTRHASFDAEDEDPYDDPADDYSSVLHTPLLTIPGCPPLRRLKVTGDGWHVLAQDAHQSVQLWDVVNQRLVKSYGLVSFEELLSRKNASLASQRSALPISPWFTLDLRLGCLCVHLNKQTAFAARYVIAAPPLPDEVADKPTDVAINLGEMALITAFAEWLGLERLAWKVQMGEIGEGADGIEETEEQASLFSPLLSPTHAGRQKSANGRARAPVVSVAAIVGVSVSVVVSFPRAQRRTALYQSLPVPPLPVSLAPRLPSSISAAASFEECLLELDRRRAIYYQVLPTWVEANVMKAEETRPQRPAEDLLPDPYVTVNEWGFGDEDEVADGSSEYYEQEEAEDGADDGEESQASHAHDSISTPGRHLRLVGTIRIHHSPASRPRLSPSPQPRHSLSSHSSSALHYVERGNLQRRVPHSPSASPSSLSSFLTLQHPSIPKAVSHPQLLYYATNSNSPMQRSSLSSLSHSPLDSIAFDLNAPTYGPQPTSVATTAGEQPNSGREAPTAAEPKTLFYLQPHSSNTHSPSHTLTVPTAPPSPSSLAPGGLPAVFHGPLLVPSSMSALRIKQYLSKKLNNTAALTRGVEGEEVTEHLLRLSLADGSELEDEQSMGQIASRANSGGSKEKALRVWYKRQLHSTNELQPAAAATAEPADGGTKSAQTVIDERREPSSNGVAVWQS